MSTYTPTGASQPIQLDKNNNFIDPVTGELMHIMTVDEMQRHTFGAELYAPDAVRPAAHWISVKDRLPNPNEKVIVYNAENDGTFFARRLVSRFEWWDWVTKEYINWRWLPYGYTNIMLESVTHWMPLPEPPEVTT